MTEREAFEAHKASVLASEEKFAEVMGGVLDSPLGMELRWISARCNHAAGYRAALEAAAKAVRAKCLPCQGTGHSDEMYEEECAYCGLPMTAIRALAPGQEGGGE